MNAEQAKELLAFHSCRHDDTDNPKWENGFLGSLRPFQGALREENFTEVIECLRALQDEFTAPAIDSDVVYDIVSIVHLTREWSAIEGMLGENNLISESQRQTLLAWAEIIEGCFMYLLEGAADEAFADYEEWCRRQRTELK
ncbi:MAG: hypothetical protein ACTTKL_06360 [Treponema sp.]